MRRCLLLVVLSSLAADVAAQDASSLSRRVTLNVSSYQFPDAGHRLAPGAELAAELLRIERLLLEVGAAVSYSYWSYDVETEPWCNDCFGYDYSAHAFGGRLYVELTEAPLPIRFSLGLLHHVGVSRYDTAPNANAGPPPEGSSGGAATAAEIGVGLGWRLHPRLEAVTEIKAYPHYPQFGGRLYPGPNLGLSIGLGARL